MQDLNPEAPEFPPTLGDLTQRLKQWKALLQNTVEDAMPTILQLEEESSVLQVGLWGQPDTRLRGPIARGIEL